MCVGLYTVTDECDRSITFDVTADEASVNAVCEIPSPMKKV